MLRSHGGSSLPAGPQIDPALIFKGGIALLALLGIALLFWVGKMIFGGAPKEAEHELPVATAPAAEPESPLSFVATKPVRIKVARQADGSELFQGNLQAGERREFPNVPLFLSASAIENVQIEFKGQRFNIGDEKYTGYKSRVLIPASPGTAEKRP